MNTMITIIYALLAFVLNLYLLKRVATEEKLTLKKRQYIILACLYILVTLEFLPMAKVMSYSVSLLTQGVLMMSLITASVDFFSYYIYDAVLLGFSLVHLGLSFFEFGIDGLKHSVIGLLVGLAFYGLIYFLAKLYYKREAFGFGDVLFLGAIGVVLGGWWTFIVGVMSFYLALILIIVNKLAKRETGLKSELPFGPAIGLAVYFFVLHQNWVFALYDGFQKLVGN